MQVCAFYSLAARAGASGASHRVGLRTRRHRGLWEVIGSLEETILLVDDDAALLEVTSIVLASEGYRVLTAKSQSVDKVVGLELGADDYITKPFDTKELLARIKAILRRFGRQEGKDRDGVVRLGALELDPNGYTVSRDGEPLDLTPTEFKILALLMRRPGQAFTRAQISEAVSTGSHYLASRYIDVHISRLRSKVERDPSRPEIVQTVPSVGYRAARPG